MNFASGVTSSSSTPSCSTMISFTRSSTGFAMNTSLASNEIVHHYRPPPRHLLHVQARR